ncbi:MAG: AAC(3) family N-acetyltransferase [Alphaproteobacteria bacterium]|nr:AAC(3) family N-acetyltransferase [Alphaproteobacteria bacterium]MBL6938729.1 AAC(3) family N-acetyltransferase [Alphaproteobacteria bacterium]MBL7097914.1 AAC(3) family N-acetyltransferase [Alphaproteobacteria bacterium]
MLPRTRAQLITDLRRLGLAPGDLVMVHASVRSVGPVLGGPDEIHQAIVDAVSPGGTMVMLIGAPNGFDDVGRDILSPEEEAQILEHLPPFDKQATRANRDVGTLAEFFRSWPGTVMSDSVAVRLGARGARAGWFVADHPNDWPFGKRTPFEKLVTANGKLLLLGSDPDEVTLLHHAESIADFPDKIVRTFSVPVMENGNRVWLQCREYDSSNGAHKNWSARQFAEITEAFIARFAGTPACASGKVGNSDSTLLAVPAFIAFAVAMMEQVARRPTGRTRPPDA